MRPTTQAMMAPAVLASVVALAALVALSSCRQAVGIGDPDPPPSCRSPTFQAAGACGDCLVDRCCGELDACHGDILCGALLDCVAACKDDACRAACEMRSKLTETSAALFACQASRCESACGLACGGAGAPFTSCEPCAAGCCAEGTAFRGDLDGQRLRACRAMCNVSDFGCREGCANVHARGADLERTARECVVRACSVIGEWSCVGRVEPRKATTETITIEVTASDSQSRAPLAGVTIKGCTSSDLDCAAPPFGTAVTAADGRARITVTLNAIPGIDAYPGFLELDREGFFPHLVYFVPALAADTSMGLEMTPISITKQVEQLSGVALAPDRGALVVQTRDCAGMLAPGVSLAADTADAASRTFYFANASSATGTLDFQAKATTEVGLGGIFNVPAGVVRLTTSVNALCIDPVHAAVGVRPGALTFVNTGPTP